MSKQDQNTLYDFLHQKNDLLHGSQDSLIRNEIKATLNERLIVLQNGKGNQHLELKDKNRFFIGSSLSADLNLENPNISPSQLALVRMGDKWLFMDRGDKDRSLFNGLPSRQKIFHQSRKIYCKLEDTWLLYIGSAAPPHELSNQDDPHIELQLGKATYKSYSAPLLIGTDSSCDIRLNSEKCQAFEAIIYWNLHGIFIERLPNSSNIKYNFKQVNDKAELSHNSFFCIEDEVIQFKLNGLIAYQINKQFGETQQNSRLAFTSISDGEEVLKDLELYKSYIVGRSGDADLQIKHPSISRHHAMVTLKNKSFTIKDSGSSNKTYLNGEEIVTAEARAGDIISFGELPLLVHYDTNRKPNH